MSEKNKLRRINSTRMLLFIASLIVAIKATSEEKPSIYQSANINQSLIIENTNLTAATYLEAMAEGSFEERKYSEMYLLGVLDSSEGEDWCDYKSYKSITIDEILFVEMKKLSESQLNERASLVIKGILKTKFPCSRSIK